MELQDRVDDKMWLVKHLERTRQRVLDDLIVVKVCNLNLRKKMTQRLTEIVNMVRDIKVKRKRSRYFRCFQVIAGCKTKLALLFSKS